MQVLEYILEKLKTQKMHMTLIDPEKQGPDESAKIGKMAENAGTDAIMIGGSTGISSEDLDATVSAMKEQVKIPIIHFPTHSEAISSRFDAIYFMSLLNSLDPKYLTREQMKAAMVLKKMGVEIISMGYVIVEPGMKAGETGKAELVKHGDVENAVGYGLVTELFGMNLFYLEAGSGAPKPVPLEMVKQVKTNLSIPLIVGGGIRDGNTAYELAKAGGDIIVTGTVVEEVSDVESTLSQIIQNLRKADI
jgi:phosphoglycerol geranylgeranyltransferase